ncbi:MAG: YbfB/YjiJ family MFS transporter [Rhodospirillaceae bacterium]|nr:YbfB/YjiJ family MFS transporter [Rhodospirillaceae bacterium]
MPMQNWQRVALGCGGAMFVGMGLGRFSYGAMVPALVQSGQLTTDEAGWVGGINLASFLIGAFLSETFRRYRPMPSVMRWAVSLSVLALFSSALPLGVVWLGFWRGLVGVTAGVIMVQGVALTTIAAPEGRRAVAAGLMFSGVGVGIFFAGVLAPSLLSYGLAAAWAGIAVAGLIGAMAVVLGLRNAEGPPVGAESEASGFLQILRSGPVWPGLAAAYFLFSFGITPHTLYWVDFLARELDLGISMGGLHWAVVGVFAVIGPWAAAWLARRVRAGWAVVVTFVVLGAGIAMPALAAWAPILWLSSMIFGAQPGVSTVKAALARDHAEPQDMPGVMRVMITASAIGAAAGGVAFPALFNLTDAYGPLFLIGGGAMFIAAVCMLPRR